MTLYEIIELLLAHSGPLGKLLAFKQEKKLNQTPLHYAFKSGNFEAALWIIRVIR